MLDGELDEGVAAAQFELGGDVVAVVLDGGREYKVLVKNTLDDGFDASPVVVGDELYLRGYRNLYRISK